MGELAGPGLACHLTKVKVLPSHTNVHFCLLLPILLLLLTAIVVQIGQTRSGKCPNHIFLMERPLT